MMMFLYLGPKAADEDGIVGRFLPPQNVTQTTYATRRTLSSKLGGDRTKM